MANEQRPRGLDALERGPFASEQHAAPETRGAAPPGGHPTLAPLVERFGPAILHHEVAAGDEQVVFVDPDRNFEVLAWLKQEPGQYFDLLADVTAVDYGGGRPLQVVYQLWSIPHRRQLRVKCELPLARLRIDSVVPLWKAADWLEREVYDLFGIAFNGHPDLRRILMPENYAEGHPLRKDFPLRGRFSRAEQTRRALSQDPRDHYSDLELKLGREPQLPEGAPVGLHDGLAEP
jgi:NADH-quinone oxidoreductase subunit C